ncbi:AAA family ATPase [Nocardia sp. NPDC051832]|uniref:AAA family ATPase n=1 Tax=Nocardia sp. NPDC051832 TaxID=3155673 RepID=UPI003435BE32
MNVDHLVGLAAEEGGVTIVTGFPASGKSTIAQRLAADIDALLIDKDTFAPGLEESVMSELVGRPHDRDSDTYRRVVSPHLYKAIVDQAFAAARFAPVVIDAPFLGFIRAAADHDLPLAQYLVELASMTAPRIRTAWVATDPAQIKERMIARAAERDLGKLADWHAYRVNVLENGTAELARTAVDFLIAN